MDKEKPRARKLLNSDGTFARDKYKGLHYHTLTIRELRALLVYTNTYPNSDEKKLLQRLEDLQLWRVKRNTADDFMLTFGRYHNYYTNEVPLSYLAFLITPSGQRFLTEEQKESAVILHRMRLNNQTEQMPAIY